MHPYTVRSAHYFEERARESREGQFLSGGSRHPGLEEFPRILHTAQCSRNLFARWRNSLGVES